MSKKSQIIDYFTFKKPEPPTYNALFALGIFVIVLGIVVSVLLPNWMLFGFVGVAAGGSVLIFWRSPYLKQLERYKAVPADAQIDDWLIADLNGVIRTKAFERFEMSLDDFDRDKHLIIPTPVFWELPGLPADSIKRRRGMDGRFRYTVWNVDVFLMTKNYVSVYGGVYDWISGALYFERTNEFFYSDMASIKTGAEQIDRVELGTKTKIGDVSKFKIVNVSGDVLDITTEVPRLAASPKLIIKIDRIVQALRKMLRNRRLEDQINIEENKQAKVVEFDLENDSVESVKHVNEQENEDEEENSKPEHRD